MRMELAVSRHTLDGDDVYAVRLNCEHRAGFHGQPICQNCTGAAYAGFAPDMRAGQARQIPDEMREQKARLDVLFVRLSINSDFHVHTCFSTRTEVSTSAGRGAPQQSRDANGRFYVLSDRRRQDTFYDSRQDQLRIQ